MQMPHKVMKVSGCKAKAQGLEGVVMLLMVQASLTARLHDVVNVKFCQIYGFADIR